MLWALQQEDLIYSLNVQVNTRTVLSEKRTRGQSPLEIPNALLLVKEKPQKCWVLTSCFTSPRLQVQGVDAGRDAAGGPQGQLPPAAAPLRQQQRRLAAGQDQGEGQMFFAITPRLLFRYLHVTFYDLFIAFDHMNFETFTVTTR